MVKKILFILLTESPTKNVEIRIYKKLIFAKSLGYNLHIVWSDEVKRKHNRIEKIDFRKKEMVSNVKN